MSRASACLGLSSSLAWWAPQLGWQILKGLAKEALVGHFRVLGGHARSLAGSYAQLGNLQNCLLFGVQVRSLIDTVEPRRSGAEGGECQDVTFASLAHSVSFALLLRPSAVLNMVPVLTGPWIDAAEATVAAASAAWIDAALIIQTAQEEPGLTHRPRRSSVSTPSHAG